MLNASIFLYHPKQEQTHRLEFEKAKIGSGVIKDHSLFLMNNTRDYHVFFTTKFTQECLEHCCFGASVSNSLANVKANDIAFLFDGLKWSIFGPFEIISDQQRIDRRPIYGRDRRGNVRYKNRVWFTTEIANATPMAKLYSSERDASKISFVLNRHIVATLIANKQVNSTPLTRTEGNYLLEKTLRLGNTTYHNRPQIPPNIEPVFPVSVLRWPVSEAGVEVLVLNKRCQGYLYEFLTSFYGQASYFNQFVLGFQRQVDVLMDSGDRLALIEIKLAKNRQDPFGQILEYLDYCLGSFRLHHNRSKTIGTIDLVALLENGNQYLEKSAIRTFSRKCAEIGEKENVKIDPHTVIFKITPQSLETEICVT